MKRLFTAIKTDILVQFRNQLYVIGIAIAAVTGIVFALLAGPAELPTVTPALLLMFVGGTTFLYVGVMIFFERQQGTLIANLVSPMSVSEYLWSKIITLVGLATVEAVILVAAAMLVMRFSGPVAFPNIPLTLVGLFAIGAIYTLAGIIVAVRYDTFSDFMFPMALVVGLLQLPFLYFLGVIKHWAFLLFPTSAPIMVLRGAFMPISAGEWGYALGYTAVLVIGLTFWAFRSFKRHILKEAR